MGEPIAFTVTFDNVDTTDPGYGPYIDLILPAAGADGAGAATDDGITFSSATYLGTPLTPVIPPFICSGGTFTHPLTGLATACTNDTQIVVLQLPFGSFTASQPPAPIQVAANVSNLADVGAAMTLQARAGFAYGNDPLLNPATDPPLVQATPASATFTPELFKLKKTYLGFEDEVATGPNFPRQYRVDIDIATGQTLTNVDISDILPGNVQFVSVDSTLINGVAASTTAIATPSTTTPGGALTHRFASVTGTSSAQDASLIFTMYIPRLDASSAIVIDPTTGDATTSPNNASVSGSWTPIDVRDSGNTVTLNPAGPEHTLADHSIAIQKAVANKTDASNSPGDVLEYTLDIQISDFFAFNALVVSDTLSDGQQFDTGFAPTLQVNGNTFTLAAAAMNAANYTVAPNYTPASPAPNDGTTNIQFRLSNELLTRGRPNGSLLGGCVSAAGSGLIGTCNVVSGSGDGPTTARITFRAIIQDAFTDTFPSGEPNVDEGDILNNAVSVNGNVLNNVGLTPTGQSEQDTSATTVSLARGNLSKSIYAVNGVVCASQPCTNVTIQPGTTVTYRLQRDLLTTDVEQLTLTDYLPLPIFDVDDTTAPIISRISSFVTTVSSAAPTAGTAKFGPADTFFAKSGINPFHPATANDSTANSLTFDYGSFNDPTNQSAKIDILFTVTANSAPFGDGLFLTNQLHEQTASTNAGTQTVDAIVQLTILEPTLNIRKGVVAAYVSTVNNTATGTLSGTPLPVGVSVNAPGSCARINGTVHSGNLGTTFNSDLTNVDSATRVTFAIVVENSGTSQLGEFDARVRDTLPAGFTFVPGSLCVTDGTGAAMGYTALGSGLFDSTGGIELNDPGPTATPPGALDPGKNLDGSIRTDGRNIAIVTYDATVDAAVATNQTIVNTATLYNYSSLEGGIDHTIVDRTDTASVTTLPPSMSKTLVGSSVVNANNSATQTVIGELVTYQLVITVPEGTTANAQIADTLATGLAFVDVTAATASPGVSMSTPIGTGTSPANVSVGTGGGTVTFKPGTLTNSNSDNSPSTITITYRAVVLDTLTNQAGTQLNNSAVFSWNSGTLPTVSAANVTVIEPTLTFSKSASPTTGDAGDSITFTLIVSNTTVGTTDAYDVTLSDVVPAGMTYVPGSLVNVSGTAATLNATGAPTLAATWATLAPSGNSIVRFQAKLNANVAPAQSITNSANVVWTSLSGAPGQRSTYITTSTERTGAGGVDDYTATSNAIVTVNSVALTKSLVTTSESNTTGSNLAIGEVVRYRLAVQLPEGVTPNFQVSDNLPNGISFVNDGTAKVAFVSNGSGISSAAAQTGAIPAVPCVNDTGNAATLAALPQSQVDCALVDANISTSATLNTDTYSTGTDVRFKLGTLTNADSDSDAEYVVIDFNAVLDNTVTGSNDAGDTRSNTFSVYQNATTQNGATSAGFVVKVVEPSIPFSATTNNKTVTPTSGDAGDVVAYTVVYANANGTNNTDAFDVRLLDVVPADAILNLASINVTATAACASPTFTNNSVGNTVDITVSRVAPGCQMTVKYQATLSTAVTPGELITNTANLTYSSLPGAHGSAGNSTGSVAPGAPGTNTGERDGSGSAPNDLFGSDTAVVTVFAPMSVKSLVSTSEAHTAGTSVVIGEIARFRMAVQIAEGSSPGFALRDNLPAGLLFLNDGTAKLALVSTNPGLSSSTLSGTGLQVSGNETTLNGITPTFVLPASAISGGTGSGGAFQSGDAPLFSLGNLSNTDSDTNQEFVVLEFNALVENSASNQNSTTLNNTFTVRLNGVDALTSNTQSVGVVEPNVTMTKQILSTTGATITYRVVATNTGNATAFDTVVADTLPPSLDLNVGSITVNAAGGATTGIANHSDSANRVEFDGITLPAGGSVTITYQANIVTPGTTIANTATTSYSSLPGGGTLGNPTGSNTPGAGGASNGERNGAGGTNDYSATATQSLGSVGDRVWYDVNADGLVNADEVGIPGVAVTVRWFGPDGIEGNGDDSVITATTDSAGNYLVSGLPLGAGANNYRVTVDLATLPNGLTTATYDFDSGTASPNSNTLLALSGANANPRTADFGYRGTATLGDRIWIDSNGDGAQGLARLEPGLPGAGVTLTWLGFDGVPGGSDDVAFTTTTGANGSYGFANLPAGNFRADVNPATLPDNLVPSYDLNGAADGSATRTLALGASATDVDFGYRGAASIGDTVWYDVNANGVQDNAEPGIPGATVTLRWAGPDGVLGTADDLVYTTTTDVNGTYLFPGLPVYGVSDPYQVTVTPPA
ncbi:MAG: isopeptide-forming domain-containing fimbrial protein, partial [Kouleothrix sp.]